MNIEIKAGSTEARRLERLVSEGFYPTVQAAAEAAFNALYQDHVAREVSERAAEGELDPGGRTDLAKLQGLAQGPSSEKWDRYEEELRDAVKHSSPEVVEALVEVHYNRMHGLPVSKELRDLAYSESTEMGELFVDRRGAEIL